MKVICKKNYTCWVSAPHLIRSKIIPETKEGTQSFSCFEAGQIYDCTSVWEDGDYQFVYVDSRIRHSAGGRGSDYPKYLHYIFYTKQSFEMFDKHRQFKDYFEFIK